jgi:hypothetical protein
MTKIALEKNIQALEEIIRILKKDFHCRECNPPHGRKIVSKWEDRYRSEDQFSGNQYDTIFKASTLPMEGPPMPIVDVVDLFNQSTIEESG